MSPEPVREERMELQFRERKAPVPGFHAQALGVVAFSLLGLMGYVALSVYSRTNAWPVLVPFAAGAAIASVNACVILAGRRPPFWLRHAPLPVYFAVAYALAALR